VCTVACYSVLPFVRDLCVYSCCEGILYVRCTVACILSFCEGRACIQNVPCLALWGEDSGVYWLSIFMPARYRGCVFSKTVCSRLAFIYLFWLPLQYTLLFHCILMCIVCLILIVDPWIQFGLYPPTEAFK
jgi:hypothetical protein